MAQPGTLFGYLTAFVTILLALAVGDLATSMHRLLRARARVRWHPLPLMAAAYILLWLLSGFFGLWTLTTLERISFPALLWMLLPIFLAFLAASAVLPDDLPDGPFDLFAFYCAERRYFYGALLLGFTIDQLLGLADGWGAATLPDRILQTVWMVAPLILIAVLWWREDTRSHWIALIILFLLGIVGFLPWAITGAPAVTP